MPNQPKTPKTPAKEDNMPTTQTLPYMTAGELVAVLSKQPADRPVIVGGPDGDYLNIAEVSNEDEEYGPGLVIEAEDTFDTRQW